MSAEAQPDPLAEFLAWHRAALERDNRERRGPALTALAQPRCICGPDETGENPDCRTDCPQHGAGGEWAETAEAWPPGVPPPF